MVPGSRPALNTNPTAAGSFNRAKNVVVAGYAIETPRLLLMSANDRYPDGLATSSGLVGKNLMAQSNQAVYGTFDEEIR
jgi:choline dehydrogenase-like flavoprotein